MKVANIYSIILLFCFISLDSNAQKVVRNLNFEEITPIGIPVSWATTNNEGKYMMYVDTAIAYSGKCSFYMGTKDAIQKPGSGVLSSVFVAPNIRKKKKVRLRAFIKTKDLHSGEATIGLYLNDADGKTIRQITSIEQNTLGSVDWTEHVVELPITDDVGFIGFAFHMSAAGKAWVDNFELTFDDVPVTEKRYL